MKWQKVWVSGGEYVGFGEREIGLGADWDSDAWEEAADLTIANGIATEEVCQGVDGDQDKNVAERIGEVDEKNDDRSVLSSVAFLKLKQTQAPWSQKKQMQAEEKTNATCQNGHCIEGLAGTRIKSGCLTV